MTLLFLNLLSRRLSAPACIRRAPMREAVAAYRFRVVWCAALVVLFAGLTAGYSPAAAKRYLWNREGIEDFSLVECRGRAISRSDLLGRPWLASFIFTRCAGPCPKVSQQMQILQERLQEFDIRFVSFTVDPDYDTPEVLKRYADYYKADPEKWWFVTGDKAEIYGLIQRSFRMIVEETHGVKRKPGFEVIHSIDIMHVDAKGRVVGRYNASKDEDMARLRRVLLGKSPLPIEFDPDLPYDAGSRVEEAEEEPPHLLVEGDSPEGALPGWVARLPMANALLNALAATLLVAGFALIKSGRPTAHKALMLSAFSTSTMFLACYLVYHFALAHYTGSSSRKFESDWPWLRPIYLAILASHVVLAFAVPPLAIATIWRGVRGKWEAHKRLARVTFPIWLYVSVTGVIIYLLLYHAPGHSPNAAAIFPP